MNQCTLPSRPNNRFTSSPAPKPGGSMKDQIDVVVNCTPTHVNIKSKLTNLMKITQIEGYNGKYASNPHGIREISDDLFEFEQIG